MTTATDLPTVGVRFRRAGKVYYFRADDLQDLAVGEHVVVHTSRGRELGWVVIAPSQMMDAKVEDLKPVARRATDQDLATQAAQRAREPELLGQVRERIASHRLPMKAILVEHSFDGTQITVYFVSDQSRVDFRELVRDLASVLHTRVHLRQVGPRDQAKMLGGIDRCGRELCCTTWMPDFQPIAIRMAKNQGLPLSPSEISGICGKLLCCLAFEDEQYVEMRQGMPKVGAKLTSAVGKGKVVDVNVLTRRITIVWETGARVEVSADEFAEQQERRRQSAKAGQDLPRE